MHTQTVQIDLHPFMTRTDVVTFCRKHDIALEVFTAQACAYSLMTRIDLSQAWAPLVRGMRFKHPSVVELAKRYSRTPAQILLRYSLQKVQLLMVSIFYFTQIFPMRCRDLSRFLNRHQKNESSQTPSYSISTFPPRILSIWTVLTKVGFAIPLTWYALTVKHRARH
jgi:hypothetical protein